MEPEFQESRTIVPKNLSIILALVLGATWVAILVTKFFFYGGMPDWMIYVSAAVFAVAIVISFLMKFEVTVYSDRIDMKYIIKTVSIPKEQIIDTRVGELNIIKNYSNWTLKGVKYRTYSAIGEDLGIGLKVTGKRVFFLSSKDPETIAALLPKEE
jgi:hypothetical protein